MSQTPPVVPQVPPSDVPKKASPLWPGWPSAAAACWVEANVTVTRQNGKTLVAVVYAEKE